MHGLDVPGFALFFGTYEWMMQTLTPVGQSRNQLSLWTVMFAGGSAGVSSWLGSIVQDTLKSRFQTAPPGKYSGLRDVFTEIVSFGARDCKYIII